MHDAYIVRLAGIDLNLLTTLDAILEHHSVTLAARDLGLTQPAVSHALRRLRELLGDSLLVRTAHGMTPTPRALELRPGVRAALAAAEAVLQAAPAFDPASAERTFVITCVDQAAYEVLPRLATELAQQAPKVRIAVKPTATERITDALGGELDLAIGVFIDQPVNIRERLLWHDDFACVVRRGSAAARGPFDLARYLSLRHLFIAPRGLPGSPVDDLLARRGHRRNVVMTVPHFLVAPHVVASTDGLVWTAPSGLARPFARQLPLTLREPPFSIGGFDVVMRWHLRLDRDPGLAWLRGVVQTIRA
ncbi:MAG: LysR family transcriptional regulator [Kofleriaceae bacterium]